MLQPEITVAALLLLAFLAVLFAYDWTARSAGMPGSGIHLIRFYLPALGWIMDQRSATSEQGVSALARSGGHSCR